MTAEDLIARLEGVRSTGPGRWLARCPAHDDRHPSLGVRELEDGKILVHCWAQCSPGAVVSAVGLTMADLMPPRPRGTSDGPGGSPGLRRRWPPEDVLRAVAFEALIAVAALESASNGVRLFRPDDVPRLRALVAAGRARRGRKAQP